MGLAESASVLCIELAEERLQGVSSGLHAHVSGLLEELERNLSCDSLEDPAGRLIQCHDFFPCLCERGLLGWQLLLKDGAEELNPWGHFTYLSKIGHDFNLD